MQLKMLKLSTDIRMYIYYIYMKYLGGKPIYGFNFLTCYSITRPNIVLSKSVYMQKLGAVRCKTIIVSKTKSYRRIPGPCNFSHFHHVHQALGETQTSGDRFLLHVLIYMYKDMQTKRALSELLPTNTCVND